MTTRSYPRLAPWCCPRLAIVAGACSLAALTASLGCGGASRPPSAASDPDAHESGSPAGAAPAVGGSPQPADTSFEPEEEADATASGNRGEDTTTSPRSSQHPNETRTTDVIAEIIREHRGPARKCYEDAAKDVPGLAGDVVIHFVLAPDGAVKTATLNRDRSTLTEPSVANCVIDVIRGLDFPPSSRGMETRVNYPFNFTP